MITIVVQILLVVWCLFCVAIAIAFGILDNTTNLLLAAVMLIAAASAILLFKWWRDEDLDPKFRILLLLLIIQVLLVGVTINVSVWVSTSRQFRNLLVDPTFLFSLTVTLQPVLMSVSITAALTTSPNPCLSSPSLWR